MLAVSLCSALHSSFVIAAEPTRQELWVPTKNLDTVLKAHPNAVLLAPEQYEALIREAGKVKPEDDPKTAPPKLIAIEGLRLNGKVEPNAANVTLQGELTLHLPSKDWLSTKIDWPFAMSRVTAEGNVLAYVEKNQLVLFAKGPSAAKLRFEAVLPVHLRLRAGEHTLELPDVPFGGVLNLELPPDVRLLAGSAHARSENTLKVAFDHRGYDDDESSLKRGVPRAFRVRWVEAAPQTAAAQPWRCSEWAQATLSVSESEVVSILVFGVRAEGDSAQAVEAEWGVTGKDAQVTDVEGDAVRHWRQSGGKLFVTLERDGRMQNIVVSLRRPINSVTEADELPLLALNPPLHAGASLNLAPDIELLDIVNAKQKVHYPGEAIANMLDLFEFQLGVDQPKLVLRTSKPRLEADVDVVVKLDKDSVQIERKIMLRSDRPVSEIKLTLPAGEEFNAILSKPVGSEAINHLLNSGTTAQQAQLAAVPNVSISNVATQQQERLITPNIISQPVFSTRVVTENDGTQRISQVITPSNGSAVPTGSPYRMTWRRVGQTIAILPAQPVSPSNALEFSVTSRLKLANAWKGPRIPETVTIAHLEIPDAVKVAGYTAVDFDDAWRVALKAAQGLEDRDARLTPVKGRMAWFGLREHALTLEVERAEAVFSTEVTAYALPRARTIEIEGQFALDISGAPLRSFQVKLPVANAKLLRVTSPLVGEQQLDEATGVWTFTLRQESKGRQNVRWRMSLPADVGSLARARGAATSPVPESGDSAYKKAITATLPHLELPQSRRFAGTWIIEANTDTQLSTTMQNMQPLDVLRVPAVAGYQPRHRITSAFTYGAGENALTITAQRHAHSELAALVVNRMSLISVLGTDGHSLHEATLDLSHSGEQFVSLHLPKDAELLSTSSGGQAVKPVRSVEGAIAIPLPAGSANAAHTEVRVQFRQNGAPWNRSGTQKLEPVRIVGNVPVLSTDWAVHAPAAFGYGKVDTTLEQSVATDEVGLMPRVAALIGKPASLLLAPVGLAQEVDFFPGGWATTSAAPVAAMAEREVSRRSARVEDARTAMDRGDKLFADGDYDGALGSYRAAVNALPNAPTTADWLDLAKLKQADCSVVVARERAKQGRYDEARRLLSEALNLVPGHQGATTFTQHLSDPDRYPPALAEHVENVAKVQKGLLLANSSVEIGNYDTAISQYQDVLRVDPYSSAARRGMENAERKRMEYFKTAADHQRAKMLAQVDEKWEDKTPVTSAAPADPFFRGDAERPGSGMLVAPKTGAQFQKLDRIILPRVQFQGASIEEAIEFLRVKSRDLDTDSPGGGGVNLILRNGDAPSSAKISLDLKDVPLGEALRYVTELAQMKYKVEANAVVVVPLSEDASQLYTRTYRVPPDFLATGGGDLGGAAAPADPFAAGGAAPMGGSSLMARKSAKQILEAQGITFPEGAVATFNPATSQIVVRNTQPNLDLAEAMVESLGDKGETLGAMVAGQQNGGKSPRMRDRRLSESVDEMTFKSGLIPLDVVLPETGRVLRFHGAQPPEALALHYTSWSQQMVRAMLAMGLGLALFWRFGQRRPWFLTLLVVVLAAWGAPLLFAGTWLALANAVAFGWLCALALWVLGRLFAFIRPVTVISTQSQREVMA